MAKGLLALLLVARLPVPARRTIVRLATALVKAGVPELVTRHGAEVFQTIVSVELGH